MAARYDAIVVGSGPNGLAAAITLARAGRSVHVIEANETVGGGCRTEELTLPGFRHDVCAAIFPLAAGSPFLRRLPLQDHGLEWLFPEVELAHPLDGGRAAALRRSLPATAQGLGGDGPAYRRLFGPLGREWERLTPDILGPVLRLPMHPLLMARFGAHAVWPASLLARRLFAGDEARALFGGMAAHSMVALERPLTASFGLVLGAAGHAVGWPVAKGGSQSVTNAMVSYLRALGTSFECGRRVEALGDLPPARAVLLDVMPGALAQLAGARLGGRERRKLERYRMGPGVFKLDYALAGPIPWQAAACRQAGTVHIGGTLEEIAAAEREVAAGRHPKRPFVLAAQPTIIDATRAPAGRHTLWAYCHVPNGSTVDMSARIEAQIERFAPGFRDLILGRSARTTVDIEAGNANLAGGDIGGGAASGLQLLFRPRVSFAPYRTAIPGVYLCSAATPPGGGAHGMCGYHAARDALRRELR